MKANSALLMSTAKQVADLAGVSQSAVSRAFSTDGSISERMRSRVLQAAETLGYRPNLIARSLMTKRSSIVGVAVGDLANPFFPEVLRLLSERLSAEGFHVLMFTTAANAEVDTQIEDVLRYHVEALVLLSARLSSGLARQCRDAGIPVLFINRTAHDAATASSATGENERGASEIARFLVGSGYRRLAFMAGYDDSSTSRDRERAFTQGVQELGLAAPLRASGEFTREGAVHATRDLLRRPKRPDAIFCANDYMALATIETARHEFGIDIGPELGVAGFDDIPAASWPTFSLTTFSQPAEAMVQEGVDLLIRMRDAPGECYHSIVRGKLILRKSTSRTTDAPVPGGNVGGGGATADPVEACRRD